MRTLRVVGLGEDGTSVVCEHPDTGEQFQIPADDRLRAAARGDITRLGQIQIELESHMRPREIQARIRGGESVEHVATSAGIPMQRVERYAHPVLLERARVAELAQQAHPVREDGPDVRTLGEVVAHAFGVRGQDYTKAGWDAWRGEDGKWVIQLRWTAGRSDNTAHWVFTSGSHGGTVTDLDADAEEMLNPHAHRAPRTLRPVEPISAARTAAGTEQPTLDSSGDGESYHAHNGQLPHGDTPPGTHGTEPPGTGMTGADAPVPEPDDDTTELPTVPAGPDSADGSGVRRRKHHPVVPAWEDVLLGVRSQRGS
ncbi:DUF3071 domain-containing protein [Haloechinothrix sp. YIM 98757]|uniref:DUF3071 domain-containing protein n=1 Tax=Haloechinothrix aidingensis TaxID=2752311 RepID=A0A838AED1_9PSEU|nr:septation protein SepH [Haloechinothrix aidingensis]MBA0127684.1 DUF3071 domain-containing protein [Haloechinothrix aidingensis]